MAGYVRQSTADIIPTATVRAAPINAEYNALRDAFAASGGHKHDGTTGEGEYVPLIADLDALNKVVIDTTNNRVGVFVEVSAAAVEQIRIQDGVIVPVTDNDIDLGTSSLEFKDLYLDGTAYIDTLAVHESATITSNFSVNGNTTLGNAASDTVTFTADISSAMLPSADNTHDLGAVGSEWRNLYIDGTANIDALIADTVTISAGTIDNTVIGGSTAVAGSFSTINSSGATTLASLTVSGATALNGGLTLDTNKFTVADTTGNTAIAGTLDVTGATTVADFTATGTTVLPATSFGDNNITNVGNIALDSITADGSSITITGNTTFADGAYDFDVASHDGSNGLKLAGTLVTSSAAELNKLDGATVTTTEINILDGDTSATSTTVADADRVVMNDNGTMVQVAVTDLAAYFDDEITAMPNLVTTAATTVGALNSGSITSGFGSIDTGSSTITTTGNITGGNVIISDGGNIGSASDTDAIAIASNGNVTLSQNLTVSGDLQVDGTTTTVNSNNLSVDDQLIELGNGRTGSATGDSGIVIERGSDANAFIGFDESADKFTVGTGTFTGTSTGDLSITTGTLVANIEGNVTGDLTGNADTATALETARTIAGQSFDGTANISIATTDLTGVTATAAEVNIMDGDTAATSTTLADADRVVVNDAGTMKQVALTDFETYFESALDTLSNVTTVGTLNSGSITSGFGSIDNGSSAITTTGTITFGTLSDGSDSVTDIVTSVGSGSANSELPTALAVENRIQAINSISNNVSGLNATGAELNAVADVSAITIDTSTAIANNDGIAVFDSSASSIGYFDVDLLDTYFAGTTKTLTNKTLTSPTVSGLYLSDAGFIVEGSSADGNEATVTFTNPTADRTITFPDATGTVALSGATQNVDFGTITADGLVVDTDTLYVDSTNNRVGIGDATPSATLNVLNDAGGSNSWTNAGSAIIINETDTTRPASIKFGPTTASEGGQIVWGGVGGDGPFIFRNYSTERVRFDEDGRVLIATSTTAVNANEARLQLAGTTKSTSSNSIVRYSANSAPPHFFFGKTRSTTIGTVGTSVSSGDTLGYLAWAGDDGTDIGTVAAAIDVEVDGTPGANDMPGRMRFFTTADGSQTPTERMRIDNAGRVGIGTTLTGSPAKLHIAGSDSGDFKALTIRNGDGTTGSAAVLGFETSGGTIGDDASLAGQIKGIRLGGGTIGALSFLTTAAGVPTEAMRIDSSQRVLIGHTSSVAVGSSTESIFQVNDSSSFTSVARYTAGTGGPLLSFGKAKTNTIGGVTLVADGDSLGLIRFAGADGTDIQSSAAQITAKVDGTPGSNDMPGRLEFYTTADGAASATERMRITSGGRVGINTAGESGTPLGYLTIDNDINSANVLTNKASYHVVLGINGSHTGEYIGGIGFGDITQSTIQAAISATDEGTSAAAGIAFATGNTSAVNEAMRINSAQRILIGTDTRRNSFFNNTVGTYVPVFQVEANNTSGGNRMMSFVLNDDSNNSPIFMFGRSRGTTQGSLTVVGSGDNLGSLSYQGATGNALAEAAAVIGQVDGTPGSSDMPGRIIFRTTADGASSSTERMRISRNGFVGIGGQTDPDEDLHIRASQPVIRLQDSDLTNVYAQIVASDGNLRFDTDNLQNATGTHIAFRTDDSEAMRIDFGQRLLIGGQTSARSTFSSTTSGGFKVGVEGTNADNTKIASVRNVNGVNGPYLVLGHTRASAVNGVTVLAENDHLGTLSFQGADGTGLREGVNIRAEVDGALSGGGAADMPGRLQFFHNRRRCIITNRAYADFSKWVCWDWNQW